MEHRWSKRLPLSIEVKLVRRECWMRFGTASDINHEGMFVRLDEPALNPGACVELHLYDEDGRAVPIPALVIHRTSLGVGVMFTRPVARLLDRLFGESSGEPCSTASTKKQVRGPVNSSP